VAKNIVLYLDFQFPGLPPSWLIPRIRYYKKNFPNFDKYLPDIENIYGFTMIIALSLLTFFFTVFMGYVVHFLLHKPWMGVGYQKHMNHHLQQYPPGDFYSDTYRHAGKDSSFWLFLVAFTPIIILMFVILHYFNVSLLISLTLLIEMLLTGYAHDYLHDAFHIENHWLRKYKWFQELTILHEHHHNNMEVNYGIFSFICDKCFGTFKK